MLVNNELGFNDLEQLGQLRKVEYLQIDEGFFVAWCLFQAKKTFVHSLKQKTNKVAIEYLVNEYISNIITKDFSWVFSWLPWNTSSIRGFFGPHSGCLHELCNSVNSWNRKYIFKMGFILAEIVNIRKQQTPHRTLIGELIKWPVYMLNNNIVFLT